MKLFELVEYSGSFSSEEFSETRSLFTSVEKLEAYALKRKIELVPIERVEQSKIRPGYDAGYGEVDLDPE